MTKEHKAPTKAEVLKELRAVAMAATPGKWELHSSNKVTGDIVVMSGDSDGSFTRIAEVSSQGRKDRRDEKFILTFSPTTILAMLDILEEAEAALEFYGNAETYEDRLSDPYDDEHEYNPSTSPLDADEDPKTLCKGKRARASLQRMREKMGEGI